jgi:hypothetical protein
VVAGAKLKGAVTVVVADAGAAVAGPATVTLYASTTPTLAAATQIATSKSNLKLKAGRAKVFSFKISQLPATLPAGTYYIVSEVTDSAGASSPAASTGTVTVAPPFVTLSAASASVPAAVKLGKLASAVVAVTNSGNVPAAGSLQIALSARLPGTSGSADVPLQTVTVKIKIKPAGARRLRLRFLVPSTLQAGSYSLVAQLDPNNAFAESALPSPIVSATMFTVP